MTFNRTPRGFMQTLRKLEAKDYITIKGKTIEWVYPIVAALRTRRFLRKRPSGSQADRRRFQMSQWISVLKRHEDLHVGMRGCAMPMDSVIALRQIIGQLVQGESRRWHLAQVR